MAQFTNPYTPQIERLRQEEEALRNAPMPAMFSPEEVAARQSKIAHDRTYGQLGLLSNDKALGGIAKPMLAEAIKASERKQTEHGEYDPTTGEFKYFPQYQRFRTEERLGKERERAENLGSAAQQQWNNDRQRAAEAEALRRTIAALKAQGGGGGNEGSLTYAGTHPDTGLPLLLHSKRGMTYQGQPYHGAVAEKPQGSTSTEREDMANLNSNIEGLGQAVADVAKVKKGGGGAFSGIIPGYFAELHPAMQAVVTKFKSNEEKNAASMIAYISDGIRAGRFGLTLTPQEKASSVQYQPSPMDDLDELARKSTALKTLLERDRANRTASMTRPGLPPPHLRGGAPAPTAPAPGGAPTTRPISQPGAPSAAPGKPGLPPGWTVELVK